MLLFCVCCSPGESAQVALTWHEEEDEGVHVLQHPRLIRPLLVSQAVLNALPQ